MSNEMKYACWYCNGPTRSEPHDADGTGKTFMVWPSCCYACFIEGFWENPIHADVFRSRFPDVEIAIEAKTPAARLNQATYRMIASRGGCDSKTLS